MPSSCAVSTVQVKPFFDEAAPLSGEQMMAANPYRPWSARITSMTPLTEKETLFELRLIDDRIRDAFHHKPGQFVCVSVFGVGEVPISISSSPSKSGFIEICVRRAGDVTSALHNMQCGDIVGLRGPYGHPFPFEDMKGHDILLVAGGLGIAPLRSLINNIHDERSEFGNVTIIYGSRSPEEIMFREQFEMWSHRPDFDFYLTIDKPHPDWKATSAWSPRPSRISRSIPITPMDHLWAAGGCIVSWSKRWRRRASAMIASSCRSNVT